MQYGGLNSLGHQQLTVSNTAVGLTMPTGTRPRHAIIYIGANTVLWRADGTDPTATVGLTQEATSRIQMTEPDFDYFGMLTRMRFIRATADATLDIEYFS